MDPKFLTLFPSGVKYIFLFESRICHCLINKMSNIIEFWTGASVSWQRLVPVAWDAHVWDPATMLRINQGAHGENQVKMTEVLGPQAQLSSQRKETPLCKPHEWALLAQKVKNLPTMQETGIRSLGQEDPLKKGMATHSNILAWRIPWTEEPGDPFHTVAKSWIQLSNSPLLKVDCLSIWSRMKHSLTKPSPNCRLKS